MTHNLNVHYQNVETERANRVRERETYRHNLATEVENIRSNLASEQHNRNVLSESRRHSMENEAIARSELRERTRSNKAQEYERQRSNLAGEAINRYSVFAQASNARQANLLRSAELREQHRHSQATEKHAINQLAWQRTKEGYQLQQRDSEIANSLLLGRGNLDVAQQRLFLDQWSTGKRLDIDYLNARTNRLNAANNVARVLASLLKGGKY